MAGISGTLATTWFEQLASQFSMVKGEQLPWKKERMFLCFLQSSLPFRAFVPSCTAPVLINGDETRGGIQVM